MKRYKAVDIIKGLAMVLVILVHYNQSFYSNISLLRFFQMGCQVFFVASGFGAAASFSRKRNDTSYKVASKLFYISRLKSIVPSWYLMILVIYCINTLLIILTGHTLSFGYNRGILSIICNLLFLNGLLPFCNNDVMPGGWYIGTAMLFYLITPLLYLFYEKMGSLKGKRSLCLILSILSVGSVVLLLILFPQREFFLYNNILTNFPCFALGMLLFFENNEQSLSKKRAVIYEIVGIVAGVIAIKLFFNPFYYSYVLTVVLVGLSTYFVLRFMIYYEHSNGYNRLFNPLIWMGGKSFYVYLVHCFFVWDFAATVKRALNGIGITGDSYIVFFALMPVVILLSYYMGCILQYIVKKITAVVFKKKADL